MKKTSFKLGMIFATLLLFLSGGIVKASDASECSISTKEGDILIDLDSNVRLRSDKAPYSYSQEENIPAGDYEIKLQSYDGYPERVSVSQPKEQYFVKFMNGDSEIGRSGSTEDLQDNVETAFWKGVVNKNLSLNSDIDKLKITHSAYPDYSSPNSVIPICMVLSPAKEDEDEDEKEDEEEDCDGTIGDFVWNDLNKNGVQDANEPGLSDIKVTLKSGDDEWETHTNKYGKYKFEDLCEGEYSVKVKELDVIAYKQTYDPDKTFNHKTDVKLKGSNDSHKKADFGYAGRTLPKTGAGSIALMISGLASAIGAVSYRRFKKK